jgi:aspartyl-tRNA(Asn)/glutamyl-tRNA(Gln) amidotransferase subunit A
VVGYKPSYGRSSRHGLIPLANSLDCPGLIARSVQDAGLLADVTSGHDPREATSVQQPCLQICRNLEAMRGLAKPLKGIRIGIPKVCPFYCLPKSCYQLAIL